MRPEASPSVITSAKARLIIAISREVAIRSLRFAADHDMILRENLRWNNPL